jgi:hypothetical protein
MAHKRRNGPLFRPPHRSTHRTCTRSLLNLHPFSPALLTIPSGPMRQANVRRPGQHPGARRAARAGGLARGAGPVPHRRALPRAAAAGGHAARREATQPPAKRRAGERFTECLCDYYCTVYRQRGHGLASNTWSRLVPAAAGMLYASYLLRFSSSIFR